MRGLAELFAIATLACIASVLLGGCASMRGAQDIDHAAVISAAAAGASGDYGKALKGIAKLVEQRTGKDANALDGYSFTRTYFYDGAPVPDPSRITWTDKWEKTSSAGESAPPTTATGTASATANADEALAAEIAELLSDIE